MGIDEKEARRRKSLEPMLDIHLHYFLVKKTLAAAESAFYYYQKSGVPVPDEVMAFLADNFQKKCEARKKSPSPDRQMLTDLWIRLENRKPGVTKDEIYRQVAEEYNLPDSKDNPDTAADRLRERHEKRIKRMKKRDREFKGDK